LHGKDTGSLEEKIELMLEKACPPEGKGITNKIFPMHCDGLVVIGTINDQAFVRNPAIEERMTLQLGTPDLHIVKKTQITLGFYSSTMSLT
jgi:hypothetical protein